MQAIGMNKGSQLFSWVGVVVQDYKVRTFFTVDTQCFVVGTQYLVVGTQCLVVGTQCLVVGTQCLVCLIDIIGYSTESFGSQDSSLYNRGYDC